MNIDVFVRERAFARFSRETLALSKVVGVADLAAWQCAQKSYIEIAPSAVKKFLTGSGKAGKEEVAASLEQFLGLQSYACDDESDAAAAGVAWLIQSGRLEKPPASR